MTKEEAKKIIEVLLFVSEKPLPIERITGVLDMKNSEVVAIIGELNEEYTKTQRSFGILEVGGGYQILTDPFYAPGVRKLFTKEKKQKLSMPSLETLAIVAYRQPVTRADIEAIRGVNIEGVLETLLERDILRVVGRREIAGRPFVYGTTKKFLTHFGLNSLDDLPKLKEFDENDIELGRNELIKKEGEDAQDLQKPEDIQQVEEGGAVNEEEKERVAEVTREN